MTRNSYANVLQKRSSILIRKQDLKGDGEREEEREEREEEELQTLTNKKRNELIRLICIRQHDVNAFVRSASLRALTSICEQGKLPKQFYVEVAKIATERIHDKGVLVRKNAMNVIV